MRFLNAADREKGIAALIDEVESNMSDRDFQRDFFDSMVQQFENTRRLSEKQIACLTKMYERVTDICPRFRSRRA